MPSVAKAEKRYSLVGNAVACDAKDGTRARDLHDEGILSANEVVTAGPEQDIVLRSTGDVNVSCIVHGHITDLLRADATAAHHPLEGAVGAVEFGDENFSVGDVDGRSTEVGLAREVASHDDVANLVNGDGLWDARIRG